MKKTILEHVDVRDRKQKLIDLIKHPTTPETVRNIALDKLKSLIGENTDNILEDPKPQILPIKTNVIDRTYMFCNGQTCGEILDFFDSSLVYPESVYFFREHKRMLIVLKLPLSQPVHIQDYYHNLNTNLKNIAKITRSHKISCYEILVEFR